jgi:hypothetical protein
MVTRIQEKNALSNTAADRSALAGQQTQTSGRQLCFYWTLTGKDGKPCSVQF